MTRKQARAFIFIAEFIAAKGYSPSYQEIADHLGLVGKSGAFRVVTGLINQGRLRQVGGARGLTVIERFSETASPARIATALAEAGFITAAHQREAALVIAASLGVAA